MKKGKQMKLKILAAFVLLFVSSNIGGKELTLDRAIEIGLKNNYSIQIARNNADISANNKGMGTAGFLPTIDASSNYHLGSTDEESNSVSSLLDYDTENKGADISMNWTLFDGFKMFIDRNRYNDLAKLGEYQTHDIIENNVVAISRAYFDLVQQEQLLDVARETRDISQTRLEKERVRNELGGASSTDLLNAQVAFNSDQSRLIEQELQTEIAREELNLLLGRDPATLVTVSKEIKVLPLTSSYDELKAKADQRNSGLLVAQQSRQVAEREVQSARAAFSPRLSLNANYGYSDRTTSNSPMLIDDLTTEATDYTVGLQLTFNIFKGGRDRIELTNARIEANNQRLALRDEENQLAGELQKTYRTFLKRLELVRLEEENVVAARQSLELQEDRYNTGASSSLDFRDAQVSLANAQTALITARFQARISNLELDQLTGALNVK